MKSKPLSVKTHLTSNPRLEQRWRWASASAQTSSFPTKLPPLLHRTSPHYLCSWSHHHSFHQNSCFSSAIFHSPPSSLTPCRFPADPHRCRRSYENKALTTWRVRAASCPGETGSGDVAALTRPEWGNNDQLTVHTKAVWSGGQVVWLHPDEASPRRCRAVSAQFDCLSARPRFRGAAEWCQTVNAQSALIKNRFSRPSSAHSRRPTRLILVSGAGLSEIPKSNSRFLTRRQNQSLFLFRT